MKAHIAAQQRVARPAELMEAAIILLTLATAEDGADAVGMERQP